MDKLLLLLPLVPILLLAVALARRESTSNPADLWVGDYKPSKPAPLWRDLPSFLLCYSLYAMLIALGYVVVFEIWRTTILTLLAAFMPRSSANRAIYLASMLLMGIGLFVLVIAAEPYLRGGIKGRQLMRRFARMAGYLGIAGAIGLVLRILVTTTLI